MQLAHFELEGENTIALLLAALHHYLARLDRSFGCFAPLDREAGLPPLRSRPSLAREKWGMRE